MRTFCIAVPSIAAALLILLVFLNLANIHEESHLNQPAVKLFQEEKEEALRDHRLHEYLRIPKVTQAWDSWNDPPPYLSSCDPSLFLPSCDPYWCQPDRWQPGVKDKMMACDPPKLRFDRASERLFCWPSTGGFWQMDHVGTRTLIELGVPRSEVSLRVERSEEEDIFCRTLKTSGRRMVWYPSSLMYIAHQKWEERAGGPPGWSIRWGVPDLGLRTLPGLALCRTDGGGGWNIGSEDALEAFWNDGPRSVNRGVRCDAFERNGGTYYEDLDQAPFMRDRIEA